MPSSLGLALTLLVSFISAASSCTEQEKGYLLEFRAGLTQDDGLAAAWREDGHDCCNWEGITCNAKWMITGVSLASRGLEGNISVSLGNLATLKLLNLSRNSLSGGLPLELVSSRSIAVLDVSFNRLTGALRELPPSPAPGRPLQVLDISSNLFTGEFPSWKAMENLIALNASNNSFAGPIPTHFCDSSPSLAVLDLSRNKFSGGIPQALGDCSMLRVLNAGYNNLRGMLPDELFNATSLEHLSFRDNELHGVLNEAHVINLRNLVTLNLGRNNFSGRIPDSIGELKRMEEVYFDQNNMSGELPAALSNCTYLVTVDLKINVFSGELGKFNFSNLPNLETLDLMDNNFTGTIPENIYSCSNLTALRLSANNLRGQLSPRISDLKHLVFLSLSVNSFKNITNALHILKNCRQLTILLIGKNFRGELMPEYERFDGFENLQVLGIEGCQLLGKIPLWISKLANLEMLILSNNQLTGSIPTWIKALKYLFYLDISNNSLTGEIPTTLMDMPMLKSEKTEAHLDPRIFKLPVYSGLSRQYRKPIALPKVLDLGNNKFTGEIPVEIGRLKSLLSLNLSSNDLTGQIPQSICNLTRLLVLDLSNNNLTGAIPSALNSLHSLSAFNVSSNDLEGPIPSGGQFNTFEASSFNGNTKLCGSMLIHKCNSAEEPSATILLALLRCPQMNMSPPFQSI